MLGSMTGTTDLHETTRRIEATIDVAATPAVVHAAFAEPQGIAGWFVDRAEGTAETGAVVTWFWDDFGYAIPCSVIESTPGKSIGFRHEVPDGPAQVMEVRFSEVDGLTRVKLINSGFKEGTEHDEEFAGVVSGWGMALATLKESIEQHAGCERANVLVTTAAEYTTEAVCASQRQGSSLGWLASGASDLPAVGESYQLNTTRLGEMSGRVLARTASETLLSWDRVGGVLGLKAFLMGPQRVVGLHLSTWSGEDLEAMRADLEATAADWAAALG